MNRYSEVILGVLVIVLLLLSYSFWHQIRFISRAQTMSAGRFEFFTLKHGGVLTANDAAYIEPWMTFDFVSVVFKVPAAYLQSRLQISDSRYPRVTISRYSRSANLDVNSVTIKVRDAVRAYLTATTTSARQ